MFKSPCKIAFAINFLPYKYTLFIDFLFFFVYNTFQNVRQLSNIYITIFKRTRVLKNKTDSLLLKLENDWQRGLQSWASTTINNVFRVYRSIRSKPSFNMTQSKRKLLTSTPISTLISTNLDVKSVPRLNGVTQLPLCIYSKSIIVSVKQLVRCRYNRRQNYKHACNQCQFCFR